jgi:hypothetical protein
VLRTRHVIRDVRQAVYQQPARWPWKKSSETFSRQENLRFSRVLRTRHVIRDVRQAVYQQPAKIPGKRGSKCLTGVERSQESDRSLQKTPWK